MRALVISATAFALAATLGFAQAGAAAAAQDQTPSFRAGVELVRLDVRVTDGEGRPVRDLKQDEVRIDENGTDRPVVFFQHIEEPAESYAEVASRTVGSEVSTNQGAARGHLYVFVFDQQHITTGNEQRAREAAQRFLTTRFRAGDRVAAYALPGPGPEINFTADARRVAAELTKIRGLSQPMRVGPLGGMRVDEAFQVLRGNETVTRRLMEKLARQQASDAKVDPNVIGDSRTAPQAIVVREDASLIIKTADAESRQMLNLLTDVLSRMREIEGRKSVIFVSEGFYDDNVTREIEAVAAAAAQSYSVIYAIDINRRGADLTSDEPAGGEQAIALLDRVNPLAGLAAETDGQLANDAALRADAVFANIAAQSQDYYLVGFTPQPDAVKDPGSYRRVKVRVTRSGARVATRTGYALVNPASRLDRRQAIDRAIAAPFPQQGLPIHYTTYLLRGPASGMQRVIMSLAADTPLASERQSQSADIVFVVRSAVDGRIAGSGTDTIPLPERADPGRTTGTTTYRVQFELPAGEYVMRAVVREPGGLIGSSDRRFTVRPLDGPSLAVGDLILSSKSGDLPVRPAAFVGDGLSGVLELYGRAPDQLQNAQVRVDLLPAGSQTAAASGSADLQDLRTVAGGVAREARIALPLTGVAPGPYLVRASVVVGSDTPAQTMREIDVRAGNRPATSEAPLVAKAFEPREVVTGALAQRFAAAWRAAPSATASGGLSGLERLGAADYPAAIAALQASLEGAKTKTDEAALAFLLGWAFHGAGDDRQAITAWRRAAYVDPTMVPIHLALADVYIRLSQPALAAQALRAGLAALPGSPELTDRLSRLEQR